MKALLIVALLVLSGCSRNVKLINQVVSPDNTYSVYNVRCVDDKNRCRKMARDKCGYQGYRIVKENDSVQKAMIRDAKRAFEIQFLCGSFLPEGAEYLAPLPADNVRKPRRRNALQRFADGYNRSRTPHIVVEVENVEMPVFQPQQNSLQGCCSSHGGVGGIHTGQVVCQDYFISSCTVN